VIVDSEGRDGIGRDGKVGMSVGGRLGARGSFREGVWVWLWRRGGAGSRSRRGEAGASRQEVNLHWAGRLMENLASQD
jgi:hypothetical protein